MDTKEMEKNLKALANKRRLDTIKFLKSKKQAAVGEIAEKIKLSPKATSKHLKILYLADILEKEKRGLEVYYRVAVVGDKVIGMIIRNIN
jgi:ArsR family transcriptional regulator, arsenate/arsenite/antimonite-responsive transcriptional repressor